MPSWVIAILNSKLAAFFIPLYVYSWDDSGYLLQKIFVERFPIPRINTIDQQPFMDIVDEVIAKKLNGENTTALESEINHLAYTIYNLTDAEINIVESG